MGMVTITKTTGTAEKAIEVMNPEAVNVGWFPSARYDDVKSTPVASVAAQNEKGNPNKRIPARPFIRPAIARDSKKWSNIATRGVKSVLAGKSTVTQVMENLGIAISEDIKYSISRVYEPALSERTIRERFERRDYKGGRLNKTQARTLTKPLIDTGFMQSTVSYEIEGGK